jgi:hypothetical protein
MDVDVDVDADADADADTDTIKKKILKLEAYKQSHPNLYKIWKLYLLEEKAKYERLSTQFNELICILDKNPEVVKDFTRENLIFLTLLHNQINC